MQKKESCKKCGKQRDSDLSKACELCGAKQYPLIGYHYQKEARDIYLMIAVIAAVITLAIIGGAVFYIVTQAMLMP